MTSYEFIVIASGLDPHAEDFESRFYEAGCDDATVSYQKGHIIVDFAREAECIDAAIASAVEAVKAVGAKIDRIEPDPLVSLSDIAARTGMSRAAMHSNTQKASAAKAFLRRSPRSLRTARFGTGPSRRDGFSITRR